MAMVTQDPMRRTATIPDTAMAAATMAAWGRSGWGYRSAMGWATVITITAITTAGMGISMAATIITVVTITMAVTTAGTIVITRREGGTLPLGLN
jgi:hypothetical protein